MKDKLTSWEIGLLLIVVMIFAPFILGFGTRIIWYFFTLGWGMGN